MTTVSMKDSQEGQPERTHLCTKGNGCVLAATFGLVSWSIAFTHWEVYKARAINILKGSAYRRYMYKAADICSMMMRDDFLSLFPKMPQVRNMQAWLCSDLSCVHNSQSSCVVVKEMAPLCGTIP